MIYLLQVKVTSNPSLFLNTYLLDSVNQRFSLCPLNYFLVLLDTSFYYYVFQAHVVSRHTGLNPLIIREELQHFRLSTLQKTEVVLIP